MFAALLLLKPIFIWIKCGVTFYVVCFVKRYSLLTLICYVVFLYALTTCLDWPNDFKAVPIDQQ